MVEAQKDSWEDGAPDAEDTTVKRARRLELDGSPAGRRDDRARSVRQLAKELGVSKTRAGEMSREDWFPKRGADGWDLDLARRALAARRRGESPAAAPPPAAPLPVAYPPPLATPDAPPGENPLVDVARARARAEREANEADRDLLEVLLTSGDPLKIASAACRLAARRVSREPGEGRRAEDLKKGLEEWRRMEADALELARQRGELIERDAAKACMGALARRFVLACQRFEVRNASQVELWLADEPFKQLATEDRARAVRSWTSSQTRQARLAETEPAVWDEIERMVEAEVLDRRATSS